MATATLQLNPETIPISRCQGKAKELTEVITHHSPRFRRIALAHLGNPADAEDAVQDALLSALTHLDQFKGQAKMSTWLTSIVINSARMKLRRRSLRLHISLDETLREQNLSSGRFRLGYPTRSRTLVSKPRNCSNIGFCSFPAIPYFADDVPIARCRWLEHSRNGRSHGSTVWDSKGEARKGSHETQESDQAEHWRFH